MSKALVEKPESGIGNLDPAVAKMFQEDAKMGLEDVNLAGTTPQIKLTDKQSETILMDGRRATVGRYYYTLTKEEAESMDVHILYMRNADLPSYTKKELKLNIVVAGVLVETKLPFILYVKGLSLRQMWNLQKEINSFVSHPKYPIPMYALGIRLKTEVRESRDFGKQTVMSFELIRTESGQPMIETNQEMLKKLRATVESAKEMVNKGVELSLREWNQNHPDENTEKVIQGETLPPAETIDVEDVSKDVPF
jgi:hypothetical protein